MALHLFESHQLTLAQAAKVADMALEDFIVSLGEAGLDAVDYPSEALNLETAVDRFVEDLSH